MESQEKKRKVYRFISYITWICLLLVRKRKRYIIFRRVQDIKEIDNSEEKKL